MRPHNDIDSEITSTRCNHIWLCNRSLDGETLQLRNGGRSIMISSVLIIINGV